MKEVLSTQPYRGTRDLFPEDMAKLNYIFDVWREVATLYGYEEYLSPLLEPWDLYATKNVSGQEIVNDQLYWFEDRGGRKVAIRPEMTPSVARMISAKFRQLVKPVRWFSITNFMRYEKPQKGRGREFFQMNLDIFGDDTVNADLEIVEIAIMIMERFGANEKMFEIRVNNREWFADWALNFLGYKGELLALSKIVDRLQKQDTGANIAQLQGIGLNNEQIEKILDLPNLTVDKISTLTKLNNGSRQLIDLFDSLNKRGLAKYVKFDASLMRGFDYYTGNVFEQFDLNPDNRRSMFGGGRYDKLASIFGIDSIPAQGFAPGDYTTLNFLENWGLLPEFEPSAEVFVTVFNAELADESWQVANQLRHEGIRTELFVSSESSIADQFKYANRKKIAFVVVIGPEEIAAGLVVLKDMTSGEQGKMAINELSSKLLDCLSQEWSDE
jgi:histidyl-tRNA synthetase